MMIAFGGWIKRHIMRKAQCPATTPKRRAWNTGRRAGHKRPAPPKQACAIRARLELAGHLRDLALFKFGIDSKLRSRDLLKLAVSDLVNDSRVWGRASVIQSEVKRPIQVERTESTRATVLRIVPT